MMRCLALSDLHLEFGDFTPAKDQYDLAILAGDIHPILEFPVAGEWIREHFTVHGVPVIYVPGNHEYYGAEFPAALEVLRRQVPPGCHVLDRDEFIFQGVRFLGATLWTDFDLLGHASSAMRFAKDFMSDFGKIVTEDGELLTPERVLKEHRRSRKWLLERLEEAFDGPTVVITHHAPSLLSIAPGFSNHPLSPCYASRLEGLLGPHVEVWIHGHTHESLDYDSNGTRVVCNPRGYVGEEVNPKFSAGFVIEV